MSSQEVGQSPKAEPRFFYGYTVVLACFFIMLIAFGALFTFAVFFEPVLIEFGWTRAMTSAAFSLCMVLWGLTSMGMGRLNDRFGPRIVMVVCGCFLGLGYLLMSQISAIWQLYLFYGVMIGIGMSGAFVPVLSTVARWFVKRRGFMTGITSSGIGIGTIISPLIAIGLISTYGWRTSYIVVSITTLVLTILVAQFLKRDPGQIGQLPYGADEVRTEDSSLGTEGFSLWEAMHTRQLWMLCAIYFCAFFFIMTVLVHIVIYATGLGISAADAASILAIIGGLTIVGVIVVGNLADRIGNKSAIIISLALLTMASFWLMFAKELWVLYLFAIIFGFAYGGMSTVQSPITAELLGLRSHGVLLGFVFFCGTLANASGPVVAGHIFDIKSSYNLDFLICAAIAIVGLILTALLTPPKKSPNPHKQT